MDYNIQYYLDDKGKLYASLKEDDKYLTFFQDNKWDLCNESFEEVLKKRKLKEIDEFDAFIIYFGVDVKDFYRKLGFDFKEEILKIDDTLKHFLDNFKSFAIDDYYHCHHNKKRDLRYSLKELDIHYEDAGYISFMNDYYEEYLKRKAELVDVEILKIKNDYLVKFSEEILK